VLLGSKIGERGTRGWIWKVGPAEPLAPFLGSCSICAEKVYAAQGHKTGTRRASFENGMGTGEGMGSHDGRGRRILALPLWAWICQLLFLPAAALLACMPAKYHSLYVATSKRQMDNNGSLESVTCR